MLRIYLVAVLMMATSLLLVHDAHAQGPSLRRSRQPTTSPYLNLLGDGNRSLEFEYFRRVRPEMEFRRANAQLERSVERLQNSLRAGEADARSLSTIGTTGHPTAFRDLSSYYPRRAVPVSSSIGRGRGR